jgi:signal transduction histidine kinase
VDTIGSEISGLPAGDIFPFLTRCLTQETPLSFASVWVMDAQDGTLNRASWSGWASLKPRYRDAIDINGSMLGKIMLGQRPLQIHGQLVAPELLATWGNAPESITAFLGFPLIRGSSRLGILCLLSSRWLSPEEVTLLNLLARQVAIEVIVLSSATQPTPGEGISHARAATGTATTFTRRVTHELRSPLTSLRGNVQLAARAVQRGDPDRAVKRLQAALDSTDSMASMLENLQDMSLLEQGELHLAPTPADLVDILSSVVERVQYEVTARHHVLKVVAPERLPGTYDVRRLEQCLFNLIANAVKYSPADGVIRIQAERDGDHATISIIDDGAGIPEDEQDRIFEPYYRGAIIDSVDARGLGLGLPISLAIVEGHGGRIDVRSEPGRGSTFIVRLPLAPPVEAAP